MKRLLPTLALLISLAAKAQFVVPMFSAGPTAIPASAPSFSPGASTTALPLTVTLAAAPCSSYIYWNFTGTSMSSGTNSTSAVISTAETLYAQVIGCPGYTDSSISSAAYAPITITVNGNSRVYQCSGSVSTCTTSVTFAPGYANDVMICSVGYTPTSSITLADDVNGSYTQVINFPALNSSVIGIPWAEAIFSKTGVSASAVHFTVTITPAAADTTMVCTSIHPSHAGTFATDAGMTLQNNNGSGTNGNAGTATTPAYNNEVIWGMYTPKAHNPTPGTNYTTAGAYGSWIYTEKWVQTTATATNAPWTQGTSDTFMAAQVAFYFY